MKKSEPRDKYLDLAREMKNAVEHESVINLFVIFMIRIIIRIMKRFSSISSE